MAWPIKGTRAEASKKRKIIGGSKAQKTTGTITG